MISLEHSNNGIHTFKLDVQRPDGQRGVEFMVEADTEQKAWNQVVEILNEALGEALDEEAKQHAGSQGPGSQGGVRYVKPFAPHDADA